jgi:ABC-2 type transport system ATP-binding protein
VLLLDEPSSGLDPSQRVRLWEFVAGLSKGGAAVIYSTHHIEEASHYGDRLVVLADGESIFDGSFAQLRRAAGPRPKGTAADPENDFVRFLKKRGH